MGVRILCLLGDPGGRSLIPMPDEQLAAPLCLDSFRRRKAATPMSGEHAQLFTIADVADACGLPQPVVAQLVPRTWTDAGWMYTADQLQFAVQIAPDVRAGEYVSPRPD